MKSTPLLAGSAWGQRWVVAPLLNVANADGVPPPAATRISVMLLPIDGVNTIVSSSVHVPPRPLGASQIVTAAPPAVEIFRSLPAAKNAIQRPSGEKNGLAAPSVPANGVARS